MPKPNKPDPDPLDVWADLERAVAPRRPPRAPDAPDDDGGAAA